MHIGDREKKTSLLSINPTAPCERFFMILVVPCLNKYLRLFVWQIHTSCFLLHFIIFMRCEGPVRAADVHCTWSPQEAATHWWLSTSHLPHIRIKTQNVKTTRTRENHYWRPVLVTLSLNQLLFVRDDDNFTVNIPLMAIGNLHKIYGTKRCPKWPSYEHSGSWRGKAIPLQAWTGPDGSRRLGLPHFKTIGTWRW